MTPCRRQRVKMLKYFLCALINSLLMQQASQSENCSLAAGRISPSGLVDTYFGTVQGSLVKEANGNVYQFLSLPYAEKPTGNLRFANPVSFKSPWSATRSATTSPPSCAQADADGQLLTGSSEDCLYLNLWIPQTVNLSCDLSPVMIFIHGGSFNMGSINERFFNASLLALQGQVIVATVNYRIGFLGFLTDQELESSNQGLRDQQTAIQWLHDNIEQFGGDKRRMTLFGQSAGAIAVGVHMLNPNLPIAGAIMESGHPYSFLRPDSLQSARDKSLNFSRHFNCSAPGDQVVTSEAVDCLRSIDVSRLITYGGKKRMHSTILPNPIYGDAILPDTAARYMRSPELNLLKPLVIGFNEDEAESWVGRTETKKLETYSDARDIMHILFKDKLLDEQINQLADTYLNETMTVDQLEQALYDAYGDLYVYCGTYFFAKAYETKIQVNATITMYNLKHKSSVPASTACKKVCHSEELPFVFAAPLKDPKAHTTNDTAVSAYMIAKWSEFASTTRIAGWKEWTSESDQYNEITGEPADSQLDNEKIRNCEKLWRPIFNKNGS